MALAQAAHEGSGLPVTVKLRPGLKPGDREGVALARRLADEAGVAGIAFHPRHASQQHSGAPDYALARELVESLDVPVILSGGLSSDANALRAFEESGAAAVMLARGSLGDPWRFGRLLGTFTGEPSPQEVAEELGWVIDCAEEHLGVERAGRYLRKFYPWYAERLGLTRREREPLVTAPTTAMRVRYGAESRGPQPRSQPDPSSLGERRTPLLDCAIPPGSERRVFLWQPHATQFSQPRVSRSSRAASSTCAASAGVRWRSGSRRLASSAISPRTPSTTTRRTSRRCSRSRSPTSRSGLRAPG